MHLQKLREEVARNNAGRHLKARRSRLRTKVHRGPVGTTRSSTYKGHKIEIRTTYRIEVDGKQIGGHVIVSDDGQVHYHPLPNYSLGSAVKLVEQIIDSFPDDFPSRPRRKVARTKATASSLRKGSAR